MTPSHQNERGETITSSYRRCVGVCILHSLDDDAVASQSVTAGVALEKARMSFGVAHSDVLWGL